MQASFDASHAFTLGAEGGLSLRPMDGGNYASGRAYDGPLIGSNGGVSAPMLAEWIRPERVTKALMSALPVATMQAIYRVKFWLPVAGDVLPAGLDLALTDFAYNAGAAAAARALQGCLELAKRDGWIGPATLAAISTVSPRVLLRQIGTSSAQALQQTLGLTADGQIGPATQAAINAHPAGESLLLLAALATSQQAYYQACDGFPTFGAGWLARNRSRQVAAMHLALKPAPPASPKGEMA